MKHRKWFRALACLALTLALVLPLTGPGMVLEASAVTRAEIDALKNQSSNLASQKKEIQAQLKTVQANKSDAMKKKELLESQIDVIRSEIANINEQIAMYDQLIAEKTAELEQAQAEEEAQFDLFCQRMRHMEEQGEISYWSILFSSGDFSELLDNYMMIEEIIQYDNQVIDSLVALQEKVTADRTALEEAQAEQEAAKAEQVAAQDELKAQEAEVDKLIEEIKGQEDELKAAEAELAKAAAALDSKIRAAEREYAAQLANVPSESGFLWPLPANLNRLTSLYAGRLDPLTGRPANHTGIDIGASSGTTIYAAKSGVVTTSEYGSGSYWSYGNFVVIAHSDGTSTLYAHMSSRVAVKGQTVKQGAVIGYVGATGRVTGPHLHFEIKENDTIINPLNDGAAPKKGYLTGYTLSD